MTEQRDGLLDDHDALVAANQDLHHRAGVDREAFEDLLASLWLYVPWHYISSQLTTEQKDLWADAIDADRRRINGTELGVPSGPIERWWRQ